MRYILRNKFTYGGIKEMRKLKRIVVVTLTIVLALFAFPINSLASEKIQTVYIPQGVTDFIPPDSDISSDPNYSEGQNSFLMMMALASSTSVSGGCSITKNSSTQVTIAGYSICTSSDPALKISLTLQAYYNGAWHNTGTKVKSISGTRVDLSATYNVSSGYYYRVTASHSLASGTSSASLTSSIWVG